MKNILISGKPGVGKTTVIKKIAERLRPVAGGFLTEEIRFKGRRVGFAVKDIHSGNEGTLAHIDCRSKERVGRYGVNLEDFESVGVRAVEEALGREGTVIIDEIGKMELFSALFREKLKEVLESPHKVVATIQKKKSPFVSGLMDRPDTLVLEITESNRDTLFEKIMEMVK